MISQLRNINKNHEITSCYAGKCRICEKNGYWLKILLRSHNWEISTNLSNQERANATTGVTSISVKRSVKLYREKGIAGFFEEPKRRGPAVLTQTVLAKVQGLLDTGSEIKDVARELELKADTLRKAVRSGRLHKPQKNLSHELSTSCEERGSSKSQRSVLDQ